MDKAMMQRQLNAGGSQLEKVFEGLSDAGFEAKANPEMMDGRSMINHLAECYVAASKKAQGEEHEWGSYQHEAASHQEAATKAFALRQSAIDMLMEKGDDDAEHLLTDFMLLHDAYHVGQMAANRFSTDPEWDIYSLYR